LQHPGGGVAPWNVQQFDLSTKDNTISLTERSSGKTYPLVFFHFHGVKFYTNQAVSCCSPVYELDQKAKEIIYFPYFKKLYELQKKLEHKGIPFNVNGARTPAPGKPAVFFQFIKEKLTLLKIGNISPLQLKLYNFKRHYHFYKYEKLNY
jgi:hypothetical protein